MNKALATPLALFLILIIAGCQRMTDREIVESYYNSYAEVSYNELSSLLADSIRIDDVGYTQTYSKAQFQDYYQWDSVFQPQIKMSEIYQDNGQIYYTLTISSIRFHFLENDPCITNQRLTLMDGKIERFEILGNVGVDWILWASRRDSLVNWAKLNHPELDGFIYDMTGEGSVDYIKAIEYYNNR